MSSKGTPSEELKNSHTRGAIRERLMDGATHSYLKDFIYGAIDGTVTTFAVVAGSAGAQFSGEVVMILGIANLIADGFSMAAGNFLGTRAEEEMKEKAERQELHHIEVIPEGEREEVRQIFEEKGFHGDVLESIVETISSDKKLWVKTMLQEEMGISLSPVSAMKAALVTFSAFVAIGFIPLSVYLFQVENPFYWSSILTGVTFFAIGSVKSRYVVKGWVRSGLETLFVGAIAASIAYYIGILLKMVM